MKFGIVLVAYNRLDSLERLLSSIFSAKYGNEKIDLIVSIDYSEKQKKIVDVLNQLSWNQGEFHIISRKKRLGLKEHILTCGDLVENYDAIIVLEDDLIVSPYFFNYVKETVNKYSEDKNIGGISLYKHETHPGTGRPFVPDNNGYDVFMLQFAQSWGQCWNKSMWQNFRSWYELNKNSDLGRDDLLPEYIANWNQKSWLKYYMRYLVESNRYFVYPYISLSTNATEVGEHNKVSINDYQVPLLMGKKNYKLPDFNQAITYDVFFEREGISDEIFKNYKGTKVIDLYGQKKNYYNSNYLISTQLLPYKVESSFKMSLRPHEANCFFPEEGHDVFVYNISKTDKKPIGNVINIIRYDVRAISWRKLLLLGSQQFWNKLCFKLDGFIKR